MNLSQDVERYLAAGETITVLPGYSPKPRRPHSSPPKPMPVAAKPRRARIPEWDQRQEVLRLITRHGITYVALAKASGVPVKRLAMHMDGTFNPKPEDARRIEAAADLLARAASKERRRK